MLFAEASSQLVQIPESTRWLLGIVLIVYLLLLVGVSFIATRQVKNEEDYLVAGRKLPLFLCWGTLIATWFGAATMTAAAEAARTEGLLGVILDPLACAATLVFAGLFYAGPLWRLKLLTTGDFFRRTYGRSSEIVAGCIQVPAYFGWIALQYQALGEVAAFYFGIPKVVGIILACLLTLSYTLVGGMWSVTLTDTLQIMIAFVGLILLAYQTYSIFGDGSAVAGIDRMLAETPPEYLTVLPPAMTAAILGYFGLWATGLFGNIPGQDLQQRIYSAKDSKTASQACILAGILYLFFGAIPVSMGLISRFTHPEVDGKGILQLMAGSFLTPWMAVVFIVSFVSVVISTATSAVLAPATILGRNLLSQFAFFRGRGLILDRACVVLISMCALGMALYFKDGEKMSLLDLALSMQLVGLFVPVTMGLYGRPRSAWSGIAPIMVGIFFYFLRWVPEEIMFPLVSNPDQVEFIPYVSANYGKFAGDLMALDASLLGLVFSLLTYVGIQALLMGKPAINDDVLRQAWPGIDLKEAD
ncbi:MAG: sodium:solute symporter [Planctomyces sp.]|nr:sodium:solute symporter [Planctomyces sp.]